MGAQAVALARAVGYRSAGTVEFIVDRQRNFYFLEMNTRLQVEHPVTELVTGLDLVELMIRIAAGEKLPFGQEEVRQTGWAIEARVYAEDPLRNFLPSIGRLVRYRAAGRATASGSTPACSRGPRSRLYYDPMIAKLCAYGADRDQAIDRLRGALDGFYISGVRDNIAFLAAIAASERFREGRLSTDFIAEEFPGGFAPPAEPVPADRVILVAAALAETRLRETRDRRRQPTEAASAALVTVLLDGRPASALGPPRSRRLCRRERGRQLSRRDRLAPGRAPDASAASRTGSLRCRSSGCRGAPSGWCMAA